MSRFSIANRFERNTTTGSLAGILVEGESTRNVVRRNIALNNVTDLGDFTFGVACPNLWSDNTFLTKDGNAHCIR